MTKLMDLIREDAQGTVEELIQIAGSEEALINNVFTVFQWMLEKTKKGMLPGALEESSNTFTELDMDIFDKVRP